MFTFSVPPRNPLGTDMASSFPSSGNIPRSFFTSPSDRLVRYEWGLIPLDHFGKLGVMILSRNETRTGHSAPYPCRFSIQLASSPPPMQRDRRAPFNLVPSASYESFS